MLGHAIVHRDCGADRPSRRRLFDHLSSKPTRRITLHITRHHNTYLLPHRAAIPHLITTSTRTHLLNRSASSAVFALLSFTYTHRRCPRGGRVSKRLTTSVLRRRRKNTASEARASHRKQCNTRRARLHSIRLFHPSKRHVQPLVPTRTKARRCGRNVRQPTISAFARARGAVRGRSAPRRSIAANSSNGREGQSGVTHGR